MTPRARTSDKAVDEPQLTVPVEQLSVALTDQIAKGEQLLARPVSSKADLDGLRDSYHSWDDYNITLIRRSFTTSAPADRYKKSFFVGVTGTTLQEDIRDTIDDIRRSLRRLKSLQEQLPLYEVRDAMIESQMARPAATAQDVFIVHGHDEAVRNSVARFVRHICGSEPVILHEQANSGRTIIEKFEEHAKSTGFAIVLLTADDEGKQRGAESLQLRARQNVVLELGFFISALGRQRVAALHESGVELPSDISGMLYTSLADDWRMELAREMRAAGVTVDLNKAL